MALNHSQHEENLGAHALGALAGPESELLERHLMGCENCRQQLAELSQAAAALALSAVPVEPSANLKASVMRAVRHDGAASAALAPTPRRFRWALPLVPLGPRAATALAATALLVCGLAGGYALSGLAQGDETTLAARVDRSRAPGASGTLLVEPGGPGRAILRVEGFDAPPGGGVYQTWLRRGSEVTPAPVFTVASDGSGSAAIADGVEGADAVLVTREPAGGARVPSELPILTVPLS